MTRTTGFPLHRIIRLALVLAAAVSLAWGQAKPIPQLVKKGDKFTFMVDGKPFIILGGQVNNPSAFPDRMRRAWPEFKALHANTIEFPVYWDSIEPVEGKFDFSGLDEILRGLRQQNLRAILLWFGTWKNGAMDYTPAWVKSNPARFPRVIDSGGKPIRVLSPHGQATLEADRTAYTTLLRHLKEFDEADRTVIMMQVENESGLLGSVRDYSPEATRLFSGPVPAPFAAALKKNPGTWTEVFGPRMAEEACTVYHLSTYIDTVAKAGKAVYALPAYCNVWMGGDNTNDNFDV
jgi:beta-galactosidase GanA